MVAVGRCVEMRMRHLRRRFVPRGAAAFVGMHPDKSKLLKLCRISKNRCILRVSARASAYAKSAGRVDVCRRIRHGDRFILILPVRHVAARLTLYAVCR